MVACFRHPEAKMEMGIETDFGVQAHIKVPPWCFDSVGIHLRIQDVNANVWAGIEFVKAQIKKREWNAKVDSFS